MTNLYMHVGRGKTGPGTRYGLGVTLPPFPTYSLKPEIIHACSQPSLCPWALPQDQLGLSSCNDLRWPFPRSLVNNTVSLTSCFLLLSCLRF